MVMMAYCDYHKVARVLEYRVVFVSVAGVKILAWSGLVYRSGRYFCYYYKFRWH